jgi:hypothetical protein
MIAARAASVGRISRRRNPPFQVTKSAGYAEFIIGRAFRATRWLTRPTR